MYIREIEIDGFKSFANKTNIPFFDGFTTISGPNGSGKSNIIDSVLFALGLSTSRTLRAEKLTDLINNHTQKSQASVKISFADEGAEDIIFTVERKIKKGTNGYTSTYYMNDKVSTLTDIHEELGKFNVSPGSYNVMMQGDVTGIINVSPNERRKILDEIAGVADFDRRIEQAQKELDTVIERVERSTISLGHISERLMQLEEERATALKYQELKNKKQEFEKKLSLVKYFDIKKSIERLHESILNGNKTRQNQQQKLKDLSTLLETKQIELNELSEQVKAKGENEQLEIKKQIETFKGVIARKQDAINYIDKQINDNNMSSKNASINIENLKGKIEDTGLKIEHEKDQITILEKNITDEKEELRRILDEVSNISKTSNEQVEKRNNLRKQLETAKDEENVLLKEKLSIDEKVSRQKRDVEEAKEIIEKQNTLKDEFDDKKDLLTVQIEEMEKELKDQELVQKNTLYSLDKTRNELEDANYNVSMAYRKVAQYEANKRAMEEANFGRAIDTIMNADLKGVHAPLAQLGKVDERYSLALETAMGGRMRFIVVDDDEVASVAIQILKSSNAGRATFLPMNKISRARKDNRLPNADGVIDFAVNLIKFDNVYEDAFYHALGDTIVVEDLTSARKLIGKYRMVTLDGSLLEKSGAMTGGSASKSNLKFAQSQDDELKKFKIKLSEFEEQVKKLEGQKVSLENTLTKVRHDYSNIMTDLNKKKMELENLERNLKDADNIIEYRTQRIAEIVPQLEQDEKVLAELISKLAKYSVNIEKISKDIEHIEDTLPQDEITKLNDLTSSIEYEIKRYESKLANSQNEIKALEREIEFNKEAIKAQAERIEQLQKDNVNLANDKVQHKEEIAVNEERIKELDEKINAIGTEILELQKKRDEFRNEVLGLEKDKNILETDIERLLDQIEAFKSRRKELEPELYAIKEELTQAGLNLSSVGDVDISTEEVHKNINSLQRKMEAMEPVNMKALVEYDEVQQREKELKTKIETLNTERTQISERMTGYEDLKRKSFMETFNNINENFKSIFEQLCDGIGRLVLENEEDPLAGGLTIEAQPRSKKMQRLDSMSGGEKSITALAFVFAIQRYMPAPFYAFDEVDMHLDGINVERLSAMIKKQSKDTQFIVVSLRKPMIESANRTIGVTQKNNGITKVTGVKFSD